MIINIPLIIGWMIFGLIVGGIAHFISPNSNGGILALILLGIIGALVGGFLGQVLFGVGISGYNLTSFILAVVGSLVVLFLFYLLKGK